MKENNEYHKVIIYIIKTRLSNRIRWKKYYLFVTLSNVDIVCLLQRKKVVCFIEHRYKVGPKGGFSCPSLP